MSTASAINTFLVDDGVLKKSPKAVWGGGDTKNSRLPHNTYNATAQQSQQRLIVVVVVDGVCGVMVVYVVGPAPRTSRVSVTFLYVHSLYKSSSICTYAWRANSGVREQHIIQTGYANDRRIGGGQTSFLIGLIFFFC